MSLEDNLKLLCDLLQRNGLNQHLSSPRPDQFEGRSTYTFRKSFLGVAYQIVVKCLSDQIACHLIRLPSVPVAKTLPHYTLSEYLKNAYDRYQKKDYNALHLVLGNVSADMDSIASALAFAYANLNDLDQLYLPLINIEREMLDWRKHVVYVFEKLNIDPDKILYKEEIGRIPKDNLKITLVDHNALSPCQEFLKSYVSEIIDHHSDNGKFPNVNKTLEKIGSNSTLIANKISNSTNYQISSDSAYLLLSAILLDTKNLQIEEDEEENKTTALDISINEKLQTICQEYNKVPHYEKLKEAFEDSLKSLFPFPHKLLEYDLKDEKAGYLYYSISSLKKYCDIKDRKDIWTDAFQAVQSKYSWDLITALYNEGKKKRYWVAYTCNPILKSALETNEELKELGVVDHSIDKEPDSPFIFFKLHRKLSRKLLQPLLQPALEKIANSKYTPFIRSQLRVLKQ